MVKKGSKLPRHPWDKWLSKRRGEQTRLVKGRHFKCQTHAMTIQIRAAARKRGVAVSLHTEETKSGSRIVITIKKARPMWR